MRFKGYLKAYLFRESLDLLLFLVVVALHSNLLFFDLWFVISFFCDNCANLLHLLAGPQLGGLRGRRLSKQNFVPLNFQACPPKLPLPLRLFEDGGAFDWRSTENSEKSRPIWCGDLYFSEINRKLGEE